MIFAGIGGIGVATSMSEYTLWSTPKIDTKKLSNSKERTIESSKVANAQTKKGIFKDETLQ